MPPPREKCIEDLPPVRIGTALMEAIERDAVIADRTVSYVVRQVLEKHYFGHVATFTDGDDLRDEFRAEQRQARRGAIRE